MSLFKSRGKTMKLFSANIEDLRSLYVLELRKALDMEQKMTKSLPRTHCKLHRPGVIVRS